LAGAVLVLFFLPLGPFWSGPFWFAWAVFDLHWGRFGDGPFWSVPIYIYQLFPDCVSILHNRIYLLISHSIKSFSSLHNVVQFHFIFHRP